MRNESNQFNLPSIEDFRKHGRFYRIPLNKKTEKLPSELYRFVFPDYKDHFFDVKEGPKKKTIQMVFSYCLSLKKEVIKEERLFQQKLLHENEIKHLEEKIKEYFTNYYENKYKNCKCNLTK
jgi:CRISPR/Cas system CSM-associated protein Csm4 (group 5 of RAMP superfamily)